jgi:hypothetical protein
MPPLGLDAVAVHDRSADSRPRCCRAQAEIREIRGVGVPVDPENTALVVELVVVRTIVRGSLSRISRREPDSRRETPGQSGGTARA